ncbi:hypothetical protein OROGR_004947 [Orobanche gracilis]
MMRELRSSTSSNAFSCSFRTSFSQILCSSIYLLLNVTNANGFNPLIQLPTNGLYRNSSISLARTVVLNIDDYGAKGDGFSDDTKMCVCGEMAMDVKIEEKKAESPLIESQITVYVMIESIKLELGDKHSEIFKAKKRPTFKLRL